MTALSAAVVAEDLRELAVDLPFDADTLGLLTRAGHLLDRLADLEAACREVDRKVAEHERRRYELIKTGVFAPVRAALAESPLHPSCPIDLDEVSA